MKATGKKAGVGIMPELWSRQNPFKDQFGRPTRSEVDFQGFIDQASLVDLQGVSIRAGLSPTLPANRLKENLLKEFRRFTNEEGNAMMPSMANGRTKTEVRKLDALKTELAAAWGS